MGKEKKETPLNNVEQAALAVLRKANTLVVPYRNFVFPELTMVGVIGTDMSFIALSARRLLLALGLPRKALQEVYVFGRDRRSRFGYTGEFTPDGKQRLADLLGKTIEFYRQHNAEPVLDTSSKETYFPTRN